VYRDSATIAWMARPEGPDAAGDAYLAVFNLAEQARTVELEWSALGLTRPTSVRDLWRRAEAPASQGIDGLRVQLDPHGAALLRLQGMNQD
jgi:hypothetical protein